MTSVDLMKVCATGERTRRQFLGTGLAAAAATLIAAPAVAQQWRPSRPVRIVVGDSAGGASDQVCRIFAEYLSKQLGQPVIVENKSGANGVVAATDVKSSAPDGYTLLYTVSSALMTQKLLHKNLPYDPIKDFRPIGGSPVAGIPLVVSSAIDVKNFDEFVEYARKYPTSIGTYGVGSLAHIGVAAMEKLRGVSFSPVLHYRNSASMWSDLAGGTLQAGMGSGTGALNLVTMGRGKVIAIQGRSRLMRFPDVPTFPEQGAAAPGLALTGYTCMLAPAAAPDSVVDRYSDLILAAGQDEAVWQKLMNAGAEERPIGRVGLEKWITEEAPVWIELTAGLALTSN